MAAPGSILGQIGESFETIAQDVAQEVKQAPKDMVGAALESVGLSTGGKKKTTQQQQQQGSGEPGSEGQQAAPQPEMSMDVKRAIARAALEELSGKKPHQKEQSVWEKLQQEEEQKKEQKKLQKAQAAKASLPQVSSKRKRGDLYGMKAKKTAAENRNVRQD